MILLEFVEKVIVGSVSLHAVASATQQLQVVYVVVAVRDLVINRVVSEIKWSLTSVANSVLSHVQHELFQRDLALVKTLGYEDTPVTLMGCFLEQPQFP